MNDLARSATGLPLRLGVFAGIVVFLLLVGSGVSHAIWSVRVSATGTVGSATVGITQTPSTTPSLAHTYAPDSLQAAGAITVTNSGSREADYATSVQATAASDADLPGAVDILMGVVSQASDCTTFAGTGAAGALSDTIAVTLSGTLAAGASAIVCIVTSMNSADIALFGNETVDAQVLSTITASTWSETSNPMQFTQTVAEPAEPPVTSNSRYNIFNDGVCINRYWDNPYLLKGYDCSADQLTEWLFHPTGNGNYLIEIAWNAGSLPQSFWGVTAADAHVALETESASARLRWALQERPDGEYRIVNEQFGLCLTVTSDRGVDNKRLMGVSACDDNDSAQGYVFELVAEGQPPAILLDCEPDGKKSPDVRYLWPELEGYQQVVTYKVYVDGIFIKDHTNGHWTVAQIQRSHLAAFAPGTYPVEVRQSVHGGDWTTTGTSFVTVAPDKLSCG